MTDHEAARTLVKSPPELWAECSDAASLARHLDEFGEIWITRLEPETTVAWEGELASGTVRIEPAGWGTKVTLTAQVEAAGGVVPAEPVETAEEAPQALPAAEETPESETAAAEPVPVPSPDGLLARWRRRFAPPPPVVAEPAPAPVLEPPLPSEPAAATPEPVSTPEPASTTPEPAPDPRLDAAGALASALESLGKAHHRPFSRG